MRSRKEILEDESVIWEGKWQTSGGNKAILEVLLDIRLLLANRVIGAGSGDDHVLNVATELIEAEKLTVQDSSQEGGKTQ
jgi:hypothetical protein